MSEAGKQVLKPWLVLVVVVVVEVESRGGDEVSECRAAGGDA